MHLSITVVATLLLCHLPANGLNNHRAPRKSAVSSINSGRNNRLVDSRISKPSSTSLSAGGILPTVFSAVAVASVIAFHEAGEMQLAALHYHCLLVVGRMYVVVKRSVAIKYFFVSLRGGWQCFLVSYLG